MFAFFNLLCVAILLPSFALAFEPVEELVYQSSGDKLFVKKSDSGLATQVNSLRISDTIDSLNGGADYCALPSNFNEQGRIKSFGACNVDLSSLNNYNLSFNEYENLKDKKIPGFIKEYLGENLSEEELENLKDKRLSLVIRVGSSDQQKQEKSERRREQRKLDPNTTLKNGEAEFHASLINDNVNMSPIGMALLAFGESGLGLHDIAKGNDRGFTHGLKFDFRKNIKNTQGSKGTKSTNLLLEFESALHTARTSSVELCDDGSEYRCQSQTFLGTTRLGVGLEKETYNDSNKVVKRLGVVTGLEEQTGRHSNRFFDSAFQQLAWHDFLNSFGPNARVYDNQERDIYDLNAYLKVSASAARNFMVMNGKCMLSLSGGGEAEIKTDGQGRVELWASAAVTKKWKNAKHTFAVSASVGAYNSAEKTGPRVDGSTDEPQIGAALPGPTAFNNTNFNGGYRSGIDCSTGFNYTYDRGTWNINTGVYKPCGDSDTSRGSQDDDPIYTVGLGITPGANPEESSKIVQLNQALDERGLTKSKQAIQLKYTNGEEIHIVPIPFDK